MWPLSPHVLTFTMVGLWFENISYERILNILSCVGCYNVRFLRTFFNVPIIIRSLYRCMEITIEPNALSQHCYMHSRGLYRCKSFVSTPIILIQSLLYKRNFTYFFLYMVFLSLLKHIGSSTTPCVNWGSKVSTYETP